MNRYTPGRIRKPPNAFCHAMASAFVLPVIDIASGVFVRLPTKRSIFSPTLMKGCFSTRSGYASDSGKASNPPQRLAHELPVAIEAEAAGSIVMYVI